MIGPCVFHRRLPVARRRCLSRPIDCSIRLADRRNRQFLCVGSKRGQVDAEMHQQRIQALRDIEKRLAEKSASPDILNVVRELLLEAEMETEEAE
jgi:hypothetical protein